MVINSLSLSAKTFLLQTLCDEKQQRQGSSKSRMQNEQINKAPEMNEIPNNAIRPTPE